MTDIASKVAYVRRQGQTRDHECHWPGCTAQVPPAMWGCRAHWFALPKALRDRIWLTYRPGQERTMTPSGAYLQAADAVQRWIAERSPREGSNPKGECPPGPSAEHEEPGHEVTRPTNSRGE